MESVELCCHSARSLWRGSGRRTHFPFFTFHFPFAYFGPHQSLPEGANSNAYCWVDIVVPDANAIVTFTGDGYSALPDPTFVARAGATNRVILLIGKTYQVASRMPIVCIGQSSGEIVVDQVSATELTICWPVTIEEVSMRSGASFAMSVWPDCLGGGFTWTNSCCQVVAIGGWQYSISCGNNCLCTGCGAEGYYGYEAYRLPASGGSCGCSPHGNDDGGGDYGNSGGVSVSFSRKVLFYEDAYTNTIGDVVAKRVSTNVLLTCAAYGGQYGGVVRFSTFGFEKLAHVGGDMIPDSVVDIQREQTRTWTAIYRPEVESASVDDISVTMTFSELVSGNDISDSDALTIIKIEITPEEEKTGCAHRHIVGVREVVRCKARPDVGQWTESGEGEIINNRGDVQYICPLLAGACGVEYTFNGEPFQVPLAVIEPTTVVARSPRALTYYLPAGSAGGVGMALSIYVLPETVSFSGIKIEEVPSEIGTHSNFFANVYFTDVWYHTVELGAGDWRGILGNQKEFEDCPRMESAIPCEMPNGTMTWDTRYGWDFGSITWHIDWGWGDSTSELGDDPVKTMTHSADYDQHFSITPNGTLTIEKFQNTVSRETNGVFRLNGIVVTPSGN